MSDIKIQVINEGKRGGESESIGLIGKRNAYTNAITIHHNKREWGQSMQKSQAVKAH